MPLNITKTKWIPNQVGLLLRDILRHKKDKCNLKNTSEQNDSKKEPATPEKNQDEITKLHRTLQMSQSIAYFSMGGYTIWASSRMETLAPQILLVIAGSIFLLISIFLCLTALSSCLRTKYQKPLVCVNKYSPPNLVFIVLYISYMAIILRLGSSPILFWPVAVIGLCIVLAAFAVSSKKQ